MALLGPVVLLIVLVPVLVACALAAAALWTVARLLLDGARAARGARLARRETPRPSVLVTTEPAVELEPVP
jgi:hypothetical protein